MCGGASRRMGTDKASLQMREGITQLDYLLGLLEPFCEMRAVCIGPASEKERQVPERVLQIRDASDCSGPMAGVIAALREARGGPVLALACDLPFLNASALVQILNRRDSSRLATAFLSADGLPEPLCCVYESACLGPLEALAREGKTSLRRFLENTPIEPVVPADGQVLANVNDASDLQRARGRLGSW